jgi:hypothetical protein
MTELDGGAKTELVSGKGVGVSVGVGIEVGVGVGVEVGASPHRPKAGWHPTMAPQC